MKVKELIEILKKQNKDADIYVDVLKNGTCFKIKGLNENLTNDEVVVLTNNV
jgi:hypothetical protein